MNLFRLFTRPAAPPLGREVARERLTILLAHERALGSSGQNDLIAKLREEILAVVTRHVPIDRDRVQVKFDRGATVSTLEIDIEVPLPVAAAAGLAA
jgi:cell division topological specificity factor